MLKSADCARQIPTDALEATQSFGSSDLWQRMFHCAQVCLDETHPNWRTCPSHQAFGGDGTFTLGSGGMISPVTEPVTIQIGDGFLATIPAGSFERTSQGTYVFGGVLQGVLLAAALTPTGGNSYAFAIAGAGAPNLPSTNPVDVRLAIGSNGGSTSMTASFVP